MAILGMSASVDARMASRKIVQVREVSGDYIGPWTLADAGYIKDWDEHRPVTRKSLKWTDIASLLEDELEDANQHSASGMYETLGSVMSRKIGTDACKKVMLAIWDRGGLF